MKEQITAEALRDVLSYDAETGVFRWRAMGRGHRQHLVAGSKNARGYASIYIHPARYWAHQLAWLHVYGEMPTRMLDHINGIRHDNRIANLRLATVEENARNHKLANTNTSGVTGVCWCANERGGRWITTFYLHGKVLRKRFTAFESAVAHRKLLEQIHYGEFAPRPH